MVGPWLQLCVKVELFGTPWRSVFRCRGNLGTVMGRTTEELSGVEGGRSRASNNARSIQSAHFAALPALLSTGLLGSCN